MFAGELRTAGGMRASMIRKVELASRDDGKSHIRDQRKSKTGLLRGEYMAQAGRDLTVHENLRPVT